MAQYLDEPVSLVGWEIRQRVGPTVGYQHDGNDFIEDALKKEASLIISSEDRLNTIKVDETIIRKIYSLFCASFYSKKPPNIVYPSINNYPPTTK